MTKKTPFDRLKDDMDRRSPSGEKKGPQEWHYPELGLRVTAESKEAADARAAEIVAARG